MADAGGDSPRVELANPARAARCGRCAGDCFVSLLPRGAGAGGWGLVSLAALTAIQCPTSSSYPQSLAPSLQPHRSMITKITGIPITVAADTLTLAVGTF